MGNMKKHYPHGPCAPAWQERLLRETDTDEFCYTQGLLDERLEFDDDRKIVMTVKQLKELLKRSKR